MNHPHWKPLALAVAAFTLTAMGPNTLQAQDRSNDQMTRQQDQNARPDDHRDDHARPDVQRDDHGDARLVKYRQAHPHAAARCHDGFFTRTADHDRACSKHGGVDVWLHE